MKKILLFLFFIGFYQSVFSQETVYWSGSSANGNWDWGSGCNANSGGNWYWASGGTGNRQRPDCFSSYNRINFDNSAYTTMNLNSTFDFSVNQLLFITGTPSRTINTDASRSLYFSNNNANCKIENYVFSTTQTFNVPININSGGNTMEINPVNGNITISGAVNNYSNNAIQLYGSNTATFSGSITGTPGVTINSGVTAIYSGTANNKTYSGTTTINSGGNLQIASNQSLAAITVSGTLTVNSGVTLTINGTFTGGGTIVNNGKIVVTGPSSFPGNTTTISAMSDLEINRAGGVLLDKSLTLTGTLTLTSGTFTVGANTLTLNGPTIAGTTTNLATTSSSSLSFGGSSTIVSIPSSVTALNNLTINNSNGVSLNSSPTISSTLTLTSGALSIGANTITLNGAVSTTSGTLTGSSTSNLTIGGNAGSLNFTQTNASTRSLNNLSLGASGVATLSSALDVYGTIGFTSGGNLNMNAQAVTLISNITSTARVVI